jgi:hypothetical protein
MAFNNEGNWDRGVRIVVGILFGYAASLAWPGTAGVWSTNGITSLILLVIGIVAFVTGLLGWCPAYAGFHLSTKKHVGA